MAPMLTPRISFITWKKLPALPKNIRFGTELSLHPISYRSVRAVQQKRKQIGL
jgi:hypothetical protein